MSPWTPVQPPPPTIYSPSAIITITKWLLVSFPTVIPLWTNTLLLLLLFMSTFMCFSPSHSECKIAHYIMQEIPGSKEISEYILFKKSGVISQEKDFALSSESRPFSASSQGWSSVWGDPTFTVEHVGLAELQGKRNQPDTFQAWGPLYL